MEQLLSIAAAVLPRPMSPAGRVAVNEVNELGLCAAAAPAAPVMTPARLSASTGASWENSLMRGPSQQIRCNLTIKVYSPPQLSRDYAPLLTRRRRSGWRKRI